MESIQSIIRSNDLGKLRFYRDYYEVIIDIYQKRGLDITVLERELNVLKAEIARKEKQEYEL